MQHFSGPAEGRLILKKMKVGFWGGGVINRDCLSAFSVARHIIGGGFGTHSNVSASLNMLFIYHFGTV